MITTAKFKTDDSVPKPTYMQKLPKRKVVKERKKIRQLLRSMLPMEDDQRQLQEEQQLFCKTGKAQ